MTKDLFAGVVVSLALHAVVVNWGDKLPPPLRPPRVKEPTVIIEMPPLEEDEPQKAVDPIDEPPSQQQMAPPSLADLPSLVPVDAFTQPLTPPPPPGMTSPNTVTIPVLNPNNNWRNSIPNAFTMDQLSQRPAARVQPQPAYPYEMSRAGISGDVVVEFIISEHGDVIDARVIRSSHREFETSAMQAVMKWKFKAGRKDGKAVKVRASQLLEFNLEDTK